MARRKTFDVTGVSLLFWRRDDVRLALARREIGTLFKIYLEAHPDCTQTQLALLTSHDRSDVSNFIRGTRGPRVTDIDVLARVADGLLMPDESRVMLGLAPVDVAISAFTAPKQRGTPIGDKAAVTTGWFRPTRSEQPLRISICGSRSPDADDKAIEDCIIAVSRWLMNRHFDVDHGPRGVGIEIMTYIANHYRPPSLGAAVGVFGHPNVVRNADYVLVFGGGQGTLDEIDLAISMEKKIIPYGATGGAARSALDRMRINLRLREWITQDLFDSLDSCAIADEFIDLVERIIATDRRSDIRE
ncbi:hypothetical protein [Micromonospora sp. NPDC049102]|uniref:hypothetical protein n=1 Tax=Micromonospora sp. NPDC049102 TaxID=3364265 RepID=UPI00371991BD